MSSNRFQRLRYRSLQNFIVLHRYVDKVRKLYHARYKCNNKRDPKIINVNKIAIPKKAYLLSFFSRRYDKIMKLKCKARQYLSFSCNCVIRMTNYMNFKLSKDVEKNPGPTQYNTDHEVMYQSNRSFNIPQLPGHLNIWKIFVQIPSSRGRKAVQMPHHRSIPGDQMPPPPGNFR